MGRELYNKKKSSNASEKSEYRKSPKSFSQSFLLLHLTFTTMLVALTSAAVTNNNRNTNLIETHDATLTPYCNDHIDRTIGRRLIYVTTLDGHLSALDITKSGELRWSIPTGPGALLSSSIHRLELTNNGQFVRMIPSLSGGIYKFDGEYVDPIPITTDDLLSSSTKFSDDLVISGGKEIRTYGVSARTGQLLYESSMHGRTNMTENSAKTNSTTPITAGFKTHESNKNIDNDNFNDAADTDNTLITEHDPQWDDVIVVRRQTQTIRAVETRTGLERWNFSVGQHELNLVKAEKCSDRVFSNLDMAISDLDVRVVVPEGLICAFSATDPKVMLWKHQFDHPIVSAWKIGAMDDMESIDMFSSAQWLWKNQNNHVFDQPLPTVGPSVYLGMYQRQLYIQESVNLRQEIIDKSNLSAHLTTDSKLSKIPWRPINANSNLLAISDDKTISSGDQFQNYEVKGNELIPYNEDNFAVSAQSVLNGSEFVNGNGFYLYTHEDDANDNEDNNNELHCKTDVATIDSDQRTINDINETLYENDEISLYLDDMDMPVKVVILSLWFWWKEILVIAFTSALLFNIFLGQRRPPQREIVVIERHIPVPTAMEATELSNYALVPSTNSLKNTSSGNTTIISPQRTLSESTSHSSEHFSSRFLDDFDLIRCLGHGGFGVVFEAKNKLDDCKYAVKRITLPNKKESRDRVMREVKTLANCEHHNIVRYFQAWVETPPFGWQEDEDKKWLAHELSTSIQIETPDGSMLPEHNTQSGRLQLEKKKQLLSWMSNVTETTCSSNLKYSNKINKEYEEDSFIDFRSESQSLALQSGSNGNDLTSSGKSDNRKSLRGTVSIDINTNSTNLMHKHFRENKNSQLSDSFQIEFVRSTDEEQCYDGKETGKNIYNKKVLTNSRDMLPNFKTQDVTLSKTMQNKVYLYIQMQLCRKESLRDWLRENSLEARENLIASIFYQIVDAVDYVHVKGLIHRDLKPSNIFFSQNGQIKIGDFGLVTDTSDRPNLDIRCSDGSEKHTQLVGTQLYMSPEQLHGKHYDFKVDIYSLGLIFFELLVYFGTEMERIVTLRALRDGNYPQEFSANFPLEYGLLKTMLSPEPDKRPPTKELKSHLCCILKVDNLIGDSEVASFAAAARRLSRSRTFSANE